MMKGMRLLALLLLLSGPVSAVSNAVAIRALGNAPRTPQPFTISRIFAQGEIRHFAAPRIGGTTPAAWQCDRKTTWPDGSLRHALISFLMPVTTKASAVEFVDSANPCSAGAQAACDAAALDQNGMLGFQGGRWAAKIRATANPRGRTTPHTASARDLLAAGKWKYWLRGPVVTQAIVEDASPARAWDFGWKERRAVPLAGRIGPADMRIPVLDATDLAKLPAPFKIQIEDENLSIAGVEGNTLHVAGRGIDGTKAAAHLNAWWNFVHSEPVTRLAANLAPAGVTAEVEDASGIAPGDILEIDTEHVRVCAVEGTTLVFGSAAKLPCAQGDVLGRQYDGTTGMSRLHNAHHFVTRTEAAERWSDAPSDAYKSLHPMFVLTFYQGFPGVKEEFVLENDWPDRAQDQYYDVQLLTGTDQAAWSSANVKEIPYSRWRKTFWDGGAPGAVHIDYSLPYMAAAGTVPYDPSIRIVQAALDAELIYPQPTQVGYMPAWPDSSQCNPDTAGFTGYLNKPNLLRTLAPGGYPGPVSYRNADGMMIRLFTAPGGRGEIGLFTRWQATYLYAMASSLRQAPLLYGEMTGMGECAAHVPMHYREYDTARRFCARGSSASEGISCTGENVAAAAFGRPLSVDARPTVTTVGRQNTRPEDALPPPVGPWSDSRLTVGQFSVGHGPSLTFLPYVITGDYFFLQELQYWGSFDITEASEVPTSPAKPPMWVMNSDRHADWGYLAPADGVRGQAWALRDVGYAALMSPDGTPEKQYFTKKVDTNIAILEGKYNITNGSYYNHCTTAYDCSYWTFGRLYKGMNSPNPLHLENVPITYMGPKWPGTDYTLTYYFFQPFMQRYLQVVLGHLEQLGFPEIRPLRQTVLSSLVHQVTDPAVENPAVVESYMLPNTPCKPEGQPSVPDCSQQKFSPGDPDMWFQNWTDWYRAISAERKADTRLTATEPTSGYAVLARAAAAFATDIVDGPASGKAAWAWLDRHIPDKRPFSVNPMWAFQPRP